MASRLPRFKRVQNLPSLALTERDDEILRAVLRHRFLRSTHIVSLVGGSSQAILRRLQLLYHHGYLERPRVQIEYFGKGGSSPIAYGLGNKGVKHLKTKFGVAFRHLRWNEKNQAVRRIFLQHALLVSDFMVALELAVRRHSEVKLLWGEDLVADRSKKKPIFKWSVPSKAKEGLGLLPDRVFTLEYLCGYMAGVRRAYLQMAPRPASRAWIPDALLLQRANGQKSDAVTMLGFAFECSNSTTSTRLIPVNHRCE